MRPPICDKTAPPHLENPGSATVMDLVGSQKYSVLLIFYCHSSHLNKISWFEWVLPIISSLNPINSCLYVCKYVDKKVRLPCQEASRCYTRGVLVSLNFCKNFSESQILWSLCLVVFHTLTFKLSIQTSFSVVPELPVSSSSHER